MSFSPISNGYQINRNAMFSKLEHFSLSLHHFPPNVTITFWNIATHYLLSFLVMRKKNYWNFLFLPNNCSDFKHTRIEAKMYGKKYEDETVSVPVFIVVLSTERFWLWFWFWFFIFLHCCAQRIEYTSNMSQWRCKRAIYRVLCSFNDITCKSLVVIILRNNNGFGHPFGLGIHVSGMGHCSKCISSSSTLHNPNDLAIARNSVSYGASLFFLRFLLLHRSLALVSYRIHSSFCRLSYVQ